MASLGVVPQSSAPDPGRFKIFGEFASIGFGAALAIPLYYSDNRKFAACLAQYPHADHVLNFPDILL